MLSAELDLCTIDARHWKNWWRLLVPPRVIAATRWALAILDRGALIQLIVRGEGARDVVPLPGLPEITAKSLASYLSGLVVGEELRCRPLAGVPSVALVGAPALAERYARALATCGVDARVFDEAAVWRGLWTIDRLRRDRQGAER